MEEQLVLLLKDDNETIKEGILLVLAKAGGAIRNHSIMYQVNVRFNSSQPSTFMISSVSSVFIISSVWLLILQRIICIKMSSLLGYHVRKFLLFVVASATGRGGHKSWILDNLNESHLDYYYAFFAVLNVFNFLFFLVVNRNYIYRKEVFASAEMELQEEDCRKIDS